ncbi:MAG: RluA family pseudouridine synthase [Oscillospiraceae bacterium]|nr:RluA family pseudouridine synthase [Oscillospiraceae bacterium]
MSRVIGFIAEKGGCTVKSLLRSEGVSHRLLVRLKRTEIGIARNGVHCRSCDITEEGDIITITLPEDKKTEKPNSGLYVPVVYEDEGIVIYNKSGNMPVHPSAGHRSDTLGNCFAANYPDLSFRPVNRLDRDTSGLCLCAKDAFSAEALQKTDIKKIYYCAAEGKINGSGAINLPIAREHESVIKRTVREDGKRAVTHYKALCQNDYCTFLEVYLETGRTHQIRVHFSHLGHPLAGDDLYGGSRAHISRQALHCRKMVFIHPLTHEKIEVTAPLPADITRLIEGDKYEK